MLYPVYCISFIQTVYKQEKHNMQHYVGLVLRCNVKQFSIRYGCCFNVDDMTSEKLSFSTDFTLLYPYTYPCIDVTRATLKQRNVVT